MQPFQAWGAVWALVAAGVASTLIDLANHLT